MSENQYIHNVPFGSGYTFISNTIIEHEYLSWTAKSVLSYILSRPSNWKVHVWQLAKIYQGNRRGNGLEAIKSVMKELRDFGYMNYVKSRDSEGKWVHTYYIYPMPFKDFQKMFPEVVKPPLVEPALVKAPIIINTELINTELPKNTCADKVDAQSSEKIVERIKRANNVQTSDEEHKKLLDKFGPDLLRKCYEHLSAWKESISEKDKKAAQKHTDYYRILKWVKKSVEESEGKNIKNESLQWEKENRDLFFVLKNKYPQEMKSAEYTNGFVINKSNGKDVSVKMKPDLFKSILSNVLVGKFNE